MEENLNFCGRWILRDGTKVTVLKEGEGWIGFPGTVLFRWDKDGNAIGGDPKHDLTTRVREAQYT